MTRSPSMECATTPLNCAAPWLSVNGVPSALSSVMTWKCANDTNE